MGIQDNREAFGSDDQAPHAVVITRVLAAELLCQLEADLGHPLAQPFETGMQND